MIVLNAVVVQKKRGKQMLYVFYHVFCNEHALGIVQDQIAKLHFSGVYKKVDKIFCCLLGPEFEKIAPVIQEGGKKFCVHKTATSDPSPQEAAERFTLSCISEVVKPDDKFLYIHSKGETRPTEKNVRHWREMMEYFLMVKMDECVEALDSVDVVGCDYRHWYTAIQHKFGDDHFPATKHDRGRHFSGNMWWSRGDYWLSLPKEFHEDYFGPEMHIGLNKPRFRVLFHSFVDHYHHPVPFLCYVDQ